MVNIILLYRTAQVSVEKLLKSTSHCSGLFSDQVPLNIVNAQYSIAEAIIRLLRKEIVGSGVLIFVSGMTDIIELSER